MDAPPIPFSATDLERRRLENTLDHDMSSLSLTASSSFTSSSSLSTLPVGRSAVPASRAYGFDNEYEYPRFGGMDDTPRAKRNTAASFARTDTSAGVDISPTSTAGHHVSAATLGAGVFRRPGNPIGRDYTADEFDPDRSLGRLVGELAKAMDEERLAPKPSSPFVSPRMPHSPSPAPSALPNLSLTLSRNDPLPSPPHSRTVSSASSGSQRAATAAAAPADPRSRNPVLTETARHNHRPEYQHPQQYPASLKKQRARGGFANHHLRDESADVTGLTGLLTTPAKGGSFGDIDKNGGDIGSGAASIPQTLATLHARLRALETENGVSRRRVRELEAEVERAREEVATAQQARDASLREVVSEKTALEDLVTSLREHLARLTLELEHHKQLVAELRLAAQHPPSPVRNVDASIRDELSSLRAEIERLSREVTRLNSIAQAGLAERTRSREQRSVRINALDLRDETEVERVRAAVDRRAADFSDHLRLPSQLRQGLHTAAVAEPQLMPPSARRHTRVSSASEADEISDAERSPTPTRTMHHVRSPEAHSHTSSSRRRSRILKDGPDSPFPSIRAQDEEEFFSPRRPSSRASRPTPVIAAGIPLPTSRPGSRTARVASGGSGVSGASMSRPAAADSVRAILVDGSVPPQTVLARVIRELEDDFSHYKTVYVELADQYKVLDAASAVAKRHVLAEHLKEVIDCLESKADQIAALYSLLHYEDREDVARGARPVRSAQDLWRGVRECLGEDARRRLEADGLFRAPRA